MFYGPDGVCTQNNPTGFYEIITAGTKVSKSYCDISLLGDAGIECVKECPTGTKLV